MSAWVITPALLATPHQNRQATPHQVRDQAAKGQAAMVQVGLTLAAALVVVAVMVAVGMVQVVAAALMRHLKSAPVVVASAHPAHLEHPVHLAHPAHPAHLAHLAHLVNPAQTQRVLMVQIHLIQNAHQVNINLAASAGITTHQRRSQRTAHVQKAMPK